MVNPLRSIGRAVRKHPVQSFLVAATGVAGAGMLIDFFVNAENGNLSQNFDGMGVNEYFANLTQDEKALFGIGVALLALSIVLAIGFYARNSRQEPYSLIIQTNHGTSQFPNSNISNPSYSKLPNQIEQINIWNWSSNKWAKAANQDIKHALTHPLYQAPYKNGQNEVAFQIVYNNNNQQPLCFKLVNQNGNYWVIPQIAGSESSLIDGKPLNYGKNIDTLAQQINLGKLTGPVQQIQLDSD